MGVSGDSSSGDSSGGDSSGGATHDTYTEDVRNRGSRPGDPTGANVRRQEASGSGGKVAASGDRQGATGGSSKSSGGGRTYGVTPKPVAPEPEVVMRKPWTRTIVGGALVGTAAFLFSAPLLVVGLSTVAGAVVGRVLTKEVPA